ncbi:hypothetical protein MBLNU457_7290t1 [Dothideomycetes sp. NU457]
MNALYQYDQQTSSAIFNVERHDYWELLAVPGHPHHLSDSDMCPSREMLGRLRRATSKVLSSFRRRKGRSSANSREQSPQAVVELRPALVDGRTDDSPQNRPIKKAKSVHFDGSPEGESWDEDMHESPELEDNGKLPGDRRASKHRLSQSLSDHAHSMYQKLTNTFDGNNNNSPTIVHRPNLRTRPTIPLVDTHTGATAGHEHEMATIDSSPSSYKLSINSMSPASQASTAPTSILSNLSSPHSKSSEKPILDHTMLKSSSIHPGCAEETLLPPIEESLPKFITIPVQEPSSPSNISVATVEKTAIAKIYMEIHFNNVIHEAAANRAMRALKATTLIRQDIKGISIAGYEPVRVLGKGSFGVVRLVTESKPQKDAIDSSSSSSNKQSTDSSRDAGDGCEKQIVEQGPSILSGRPLLQYLSRRSDKSKSNKLQQLDPKEVYAMKVIRKTNMLRNSQEAHTRAERDFLVASEGSPWIVPLIAAFQDNRNLYLVMEFMPGGDFLGLLLREDVLDEPVAK